MTGDGWEPGRWWSVIGPDGKLWCGTSDEDEARRAVRPGDCLRRQEVRTEERWVDVETGEDQRPGVLRRSLLQSVRRAGGDIQRMVDDANPYDIRREL